MNLAGIARNIAPYAPALATALGGPVAGAAVGAISAALGCDKSPQAVITSVQNASADDLLKLKVADNDFQQKMAQLGVDLEKIAADDRANARDREIKTGDKVGMHIMAYLIIAGYAYVQWYVMGHVIDASMRELVMRSMGTLDAALTLVLSYYFGSSASSADKNKLFATK